MKIPFILASLTVCFLLWCHLQYWHWPMDKAPHSYWEMPEGTDWTPAWWQFAPLASVGKVFGTPAIVISFSLSEQVVAWEWVWVVHDLLIASELAFAFYLVYLPARYWLTRKERRQARLKM